MMNIMVLSRQEDAYNNLRELYQKEGLSDED